MARLAVIALIGVSLVGGCGGGDDGTTTATTSSTRTTSSGRPAIEGTTPDAILSAYRAFWDVYKEASDPMDPSHPRIAEVAVDAEYKQLVTLFAAHLDAHEVFRGHLDLRPEVESAANGQATVVDCMLDGLGIYWTDTDPPTRRDKPDETRFTRRITMKLVDGVWKVSYVGPIGDPCSVP